MIKIITSSGSEIIAATPSMALLHWHMSLLPESSKLIKPFEVVVDKQKVNAPYDPMFLPVVLGAIERTFGTSPEVSEDVHGFMITAKYEKICIKIIEWLFVNGNIVELDFGESR